MNTKVMRVWAILVILMMVRGSAVFAAATTWTGTGNWFTDTGNWSGLAAPTNGDDVVIASGSVVLSSSTPELSSLTMNGGTLNFTNWSTKLSATNVTINAGTVAPAVAFSTSQMSNRVWIACSNFFIASGAFVNANVKGYAGVTGIGQGPGASTAARGGAGHGGFGGNFVNGGLPYDSTNAPVQPGSSGGGDGSLSGSGGGAILIDATGAVTVNGTLTANAATTAGGNSGAGSGGAVQINCSVFGGTNGTVSANGGNTGGNGGLGGGGRIAINYNPVAQSNAAASTVTLSSRDGNTGSGYYPDVGTVYLPDAQLLGTNFPHSGFLVIPGFTNWSVASLTVSGHARLAGDGILVYVTNDVLITGANNGLDIGGNAFIAGSIKREGVQGNYLIDSRMSSRPVLAVGGNLTITNSAALRLYCPVTNAPGPGYGILVSVTGDIVVASGAAIYPYSSPTNGASAEFNCANFRVLSGGSVNADMLGFCSTASSGYGPGAGGSRAGGGYGGFGGNYSGGGGLPAGSYAAPNLPGSSGGNEGGNSSGAAGGLVRIAATNNVMVNGTITANGGQAGGNAGGGSGGGIYITCATFSGNGGIVRASGGTLSGNGGSGGGGRIAIVYDATAQAAAAAVNVTITATPGTTAPSYPGDIGTIYFTDLQLLTNNITKINGQLPGVASWSPDHLTVSNCWVRFSADGVAIAVTNDIRVQGASGKLEIGGGRILTNGCYRDATLTSFILYSADDPALSCGGGLLVTNSGSLYVYAARTNAAGQNYGALVSVTGAMVVASNSWVYPAAYPTNEGSVRFVVQQLTVDRFGGFNANLLGYPGGNNLGSGGFGPSAAGARGGGGYGGQGGYVPAGGTYGLSNAPARPGSGGGSFGAATGHGGGGLIWVDARGPVVLNGTMVADSDTGPWSNVGAGSGGGIFVTCNGFSGGANGRLWANGGGNTSLNGGGGGGGRIAVWYTTVRDADRTYLLNGQNGLVNYLALSNAIDSFAGTTSVLPGTGSVCCTIPQPGTVVFLTVAYPPQGSVIWVR